MLPPEFVAPAVLFVILVAFWLQFDHQTGKSAILRPVLRLNALSRARLAAKESC